jgi:hypothetical protein
VLVTTTYRVPAANRAAFVKAMAGVRVARRRTGATRWGLFQDGEDPEQFVEVCQVPTWAEYLRQHEERRTGDGRRAEEEAVALAEGPPTVTHLLPVDSPD